MKNLSIFLTFILISSCATSPNDKFNTLIKNKDCDEAAENIPSLELKKVLAKTQTFSGTVASYTLTGASYGADALLYVVSGVVVPVAACAVAMAHSGATGAPYSGTDNRINLCAQMVQNVTTKKSNFGETVFEGTMDWRCSDVNYISGYLAQISECHLASGNKEKAKAQLKGMLAFKESEKCLSEDEEDKVFNRINSIN